MWNLLYLAAAHCSLKFGYSFRGKTVLKSQHVLRLGRLFLKKAFGSFKGKKPLQKNCTYYEHFSISTLNKKTPKSLFGKELFTETQNHSACLTSFRRKQGMLRTPKVAFLRRKNSSQKMFETWCRNISCAKPFQPLKKGCFCT